MEIEHFSRKYTVRSITEEDVDEVFDLCRQNTLFYKYCPPFVTEDSIRCDMKILPPQKSMDDKYYIGFYQKNKLIAVMDLIDGYPDLQIAYIGFFMTDVSVQHKGIGSEIINGLCDYLRRQNYKAVKLGWVEGNDQSEGFWHKNHFIETGVSNSTDGYTVIVAQRSL